MTNIAEFARNCRESASSEGRKARMWGALHLTLGVPAAILAALVGASAFTDLFGQTLSGIAALTAAALSASLAALGAPERQRKAVRTRDGLTTLADEVNDYVQIEALSPEGKLDAVELWGEFRKRREVLSSGQPLPPKAEKERFPMPGAREEDYAWLMD